MGYSPEMRDKLSTPLCGARKKDGSKCRAFAGQGTDHIGHGPCKYHGGSTAAHRKSAVKLEAKARMVKLGVPMDRIHPGEALDGLLRASAGHVNWLREEIIELADLGTNEAAVLLRMYDDERDRLTRISEAAVRSGVAIEMVKMEESRALAMVTLIRDAAKDAGFTDTQVRALGAAFHKAAASAPAVEHSDPERAAAEVAAAEQRLAELRAKSVRDDERRVSREADRRVRELSSLTFPPDEMIPEPATAE